jgi:CRP-like cAMP-binding protein
LSPTSIESWSETARISWSKRTTRSPAAEEQQGGGSDGSQQQVAVLRDGDFFGEIALFSDVPRTATAKARQSAVLLALDREQFDNLMLDEPALREKFEGIAALRRQQLQLLH